MSINIQELRKPHNEKILLLSKTKSEEEIKVAEYQKRIDCIQEEAKKNSEEVEQLKNDVRSAIVAGEDYFAVSHDLKAKSLDTEAFSGAKKVLEEVIADENAKMEGIQRQIDECMIELLKLDVIPLIEELNQANEKIAGIYKDYEKLAWKIGSVAPKGKHYTTILPRSKDILNDLVYTTTADTGLHINNISKLFLRFPGAEKNTTNEANIYYSTVRDSLENKIGINGTTTE